jgi:Zn-dependent peptidase ImmA (M78 family)
MIEIAYSSFGSGEPRPMKAAAIRGIAAALRRQVFAGQAKPIDVTEFARRTGWLRINGRTIRVFWDLAHKVHDGKGVAVLGICEHDPQEPGAVMISLNADLVDEPELWRSTAAHEFGHAVFDMPAAIGGGARQTFRTRRDSDRTAAPMDWREWRADEFMGAFLVPPYQLAKAFARSASTAGIPLRWKGASKLSTPAVVAHEADVDAIGAITDMLAEEFGVSSAFMSVRLRKCGHIVASF